MTGLAARREGAFVQAEGRRGRTARHGAGWCFKKTGMRVAWGVGGALGYMLRRRASRLFYSTEGAKGQVVVQVSDGTRKRTKRESGGSLTKRVHQTLGSEGRR